MRHLCGMTVCVTYSDLLSRSIQRWASGLDRLVVVTSTADTATQALAGRAGVELYTTDVFYANGAKFNKGAAILEASREAGFRVDGDWLLLFDADIVPSVNWRAELDALAPVPGNLYGAKRWQLAEDQPIPAGDARPGPPMPQGWVIGFFSLFHATDPLAFPADRPWIDPWWPHAGSYDTHFSNRWTRRTPWDRPWIPGEPTTGHQIVLPLTTYHLGEERTHWHGRGNVADMKAMLEARKRHGGRWEHERIESPI